MLGCHVFAASFCRDHRIAQHLLGASDLPKALAAALQCTLTLAEQVNPAAAAAAAAVKQLRVWSSDFAGLLYALLHCRKQRPLSFSLHLRTL
jgi:hypothetical protein